MNRPAIEKFVYDPEWDELLKFLESHFDVDYEIESIDTSTHPESVAAQVIAAQKIKKCFVAFRNSCENIRRQKENTPTTFR